MDDYTGGRALDTSADAILYADREGLVACFPDYKELFVDIDSDAEYAKFERLFATLQSHLGRMEARITPSRNKPEGKHIRITAPIYVTRWVRLALQASLGSDPMRELLSCIRAIRGDETPTLFFEKPEVAEQLAEAA